MLTPKVALAGNSFIPRNTDFTKSAHLFLAIKAPLSKLIANKLSIC